MNTTARIQDLLTASGIGAHPRVVEPSSSNSIDSIDPGTGHSTAAVSLDGAQEYERVVKAASQVQGEWAMVPAPKRGELVRRIGNAFRDRLEPLGELVSLESGKIRAEGIGEMQECVDIADFAVGLSRQLHGITMHSERPLHRMYEQWHPLGTIGIITAFNFPAAVWAWNSMLAAVCGDTMIWKPSLMAPLTAIAMNEVARDVMGDQDIFTPSHGDPRDVFGLVIGSDDEVGERMIADRRLPLISATGSCRMGRRVGEVVGGRLGKTLLELGGNNAMIIMPDADMELVPRAVLFGAMGTAGQRCTSTRRLICHEDCIDQVIASLLPAYSSVPVGHQLEDTTLMGPLVRQASVDAMRTAIQQAVEQGCEVLCGGVEGIDRHSERGGFYVEPTIIRVPAGSQPPITREETFAPILYVFSVGSLEEAVALQNDSSHGLSSAIFTDSMRSAERFLSHLGSDCGIANVNIGTSGAEIGGAFGGEKDTGGGRESGSDAWKQYMRRQTCTLNWGTDLPLAQGLEFG